MGGRQKRRGACTRTGDISRVHDPTKLGRRVCNTTMTNQVEPAGDRIQRGMNFFFFFYYTSSEKQVFKYIFEVTC